MRRRRSSDAQGSSEGGGKCPSIGLDISSEGDTSSIYGMEKKNTEMNSQTSRPPGDSGLRQHYRRFYLLHSAFAVAVLVAGIINNGGNRKYIPVDSKALFNLVYSQTSNNEATAGETCGRAYVNVHSSSVEEEYAAICCPSSGDNNDKDYPSNLCHPRIPIVGISTQQLPFARRLTRLMEAWILPLLPILICLAYHMVTFVWVYISRSWSVQDKNNNILRREATSLSSESSSSLSSKASAALLEQNDSSTSEAHRPIKKMVQQTLLRLLFYFVLLNFRGWGLYIGANALEDYVMVPWFTGNTVVSPLRTNSMSDVEHDLHYNNNKEPQCWYKDVLKARHKSAMEIGGHSDCYGRPFDFSDHVVLFLAHYLPIFVMEMILYASSPFWNLQVTDRSAVKEGKAAYFLSRTVLWNALHMFLFLYMHLLVLHALYQTAVYFHTPAEILVGYGVSLIMQIPMVYLMCSERARIARKYLGLPDKGRMASEKGD